MFLCGLGAQVHNESVCERAHPLRFSYASRGLVWSWAMVVPTCLSYQRVKWMKLRPFRSFDAAQWPRNCSEDADAILAVETIGKAVVAGSR